MYDNILLFASVVGLYIGYQKGNETDMPEEFDK